MTAIERSKTPERAIGPGSFIAFGTSASPRRPPRLTCLADTNRRLIASRLSPTRLLGVWNGRASPALRPLAGPARDLGPARGDAGAHSRTRRRRGCRRPGPRLAAAGNDRQRMASLALFRDHLRGRLARMRDPIRFDKDGNPVSSGTAPARARRDRRCFACGARGSGASTWGLDLAAQTEVDQSVFHCLLADFEAVG